MTWESLDEMIDRYLMREGSYRPPIGYPRRANGTSQARSSRQWDETHELLDETSNDLEYLVMSGAWASLNREHDQALRADSRNRKVGAVVFRVPNRSAAETLELIEVGKTLLRGLIRRRGLDA